jgi:hypothetical protein
MVKDSNLRHRVGFAGVGYLGNIFLEPTDVSFANVSFGEGTVNAVTSGFYANSNGLPHPQDSFGGVGGCNVVTRCLVTPHDQVDSGDKGPPFSGGDFLWAIPWQIGWAALLEQNLQRPITTSSLMQLVRHQSKRPGRAPSRKMQAIQHPLI